MTDDDWETRFTKSVVRNIARTRESAGMTIEAFANRCDEIVQEPGRFKPNTLQGLFANKRKGVTISELVVFAAALNVPVASLLVPFEGGERVPAFYGGTVSAFEFWEAVTGINGRLEKTDAARRVQARARAIAEYSDAVQSLYSSIVSVTYKESDDLNAMDLSSIPLLSLTLNLNAALREVRYRLELFDGDGFTVNEKDPVVQWARQTDPDAMTVGAAVAFGRTIVPPDDRVGGM